MKYPIKIILELSKNKNTRASHVDFLMKHFEPAVFVNFKKDKPRSGICYKLDSIKDYPSLLELAIIRADHKNDNNKNSNSPTA